MIEFDDNETGDLKLALNRVVLGKHYRFVMVVRQEIWEDFLSVNSPGTEILESRDAYDIAKEFWENTLQGLADEEIAKLGGDLIDVTIVRPTLDSLEKRRTVTNQHRGDG